MNFGYLKILKVDSLDLQISSHDMSIVLCSLTHATLKVPSPCDK
jgi:hypothetical protein